MTTDSHLPAHPAHSATAAAPAVHRISEPSILSNLPRHDVVYQVTTATQTSRRAYLNISSRSAIVRVHHPAQSIVHVRLLAPRVVELDATVAFRSGKDQNGEGNRVDGLRWPEGHVRQCCGWRPDELPVHLPDWWTLALSSANRVVGAVSRTT